MNPKVGMLQFLPNTMPMKGLIHTANKDLAKIGMHFGVQSRDDHLKALQDTSGKKTKSFQSLLLKLKNDELKKMYHKMSSSFQGFHFLQRNFTISHAHNCLIGYAILILSDLLN